MRCTGPRCPKRDRDELGAENYCRECGDMTHDECDCHCVPAVAVVELLVNGDVLCRVDAPGMAAMSRFGLAGADGWVELVNARALLLAVNGEPVFCGPTMQDADAKPVELVVRFKAADE